MDLKTFKYVVELADELSMNGSTAIEVVTALRLAMEGYSLDFNAGDLVQLQDGRIGKVHARAELFFYIDMPCGGLEIALPTHMTRVSIAPTAEEVCSDANLVVDEDEPECDNCGHALQGEAYSDSHRVFCRKACEDDFYCQGP